MKSHIVFAGGGTAGHLMPAIAVADVLVEQGHETDSISFFCSRRLVDTEVLADTKYNQVSFRGSGFNRSWQLTSIVHNVKAVIQFIWNCFRAYGQLRKHKTALVVVVGGFIAAPVAVAAKVSRIPIAVIQVDSVPGLVNRLVARIARVVTVPDNSVRLSHARVTGIPVRREIAAIVRSEKDATEAKKTLGVDATKPLVVFLGGSLGAKRINDAVEEFRRADSFPFSIYQIVGVHQSELNPVASFSEKITVVHYVTDMVTLYRAADVIVARAGAVTSAELATLGLPCVLIPLPHSPGDHQMKNAQRLVEMGIGIVIPNDQCDASHLLPVIESQLKMENLSTSDPTSAAEKIADVINEVISAT